MPKVGFVSLGCPKNLVDSEVMMGILARSGYEITPRAGDADVLVVNTCSFIAPAQQESVQSILEMAEYKKFGRAQKLIVAGCMVERYRDEIREQIPEVDAVILTGGNRHDVTVDRVTVDAVAAQARASKATVYRRWPSKAELVLAAFIEGCRQVAVMPNTGTLPTTPRTVSTT